MLAISPIAGSTIAGTADDPGGFVSIIESADQLASISNLYIQGNLSKTEDNDIVNATLQYNGVGSLSVTELNDTISSVGNLLISATYPGIEGNDTLTALAKLAITATFGVTEESDDFDIVMQLTPNFGAVGYTEANDNSSIVGSQGYASGSTAISFAPHGKLVGQAHASGQTGISFNTTGNGLAKIKMSGSAGFGFTTSGSMKLTGQLKSKVDFNFNVNGNIKATGALKGQTDIAFSAIPLGITVKTKASTGISFNVEGELSGLRLEDITKDLIAPANANPRIMLMKSIPGYRFYLIETTNKVEKSPKVGKRESIYAAVLDTNSGVWDRKHLLTGSDDLPRTVGYAGEFITPNKLFGSLQLTNVQVNPQPIENRTFAFDFDGTKLSFSVDEFFSRRIPKVDPKYWDDPAPHFAFNGSNYFSIWLTTQTQRYEIFKQNTGWERLIPTYNGAPFYITQLTSFKWDTLNNQFVLIGNNGNSYYSSNGYEWV